MSLLFMGYVKVALDDTQLKIFFIYLTGLGADPQLVYFLPF